MEKAVAATDALRKVLVKDARIWALELEMAKAATDKVKKIPSCKDGCPDVSIEEIMPPPCA